MDVGLDTGAILLERATPIEAGDTAGSLTQRLSQLGAEAIVEALARLDSLAPRAQPVEGVTYAAKISKAEASIDWTASAADTERRVRAFNPAPGAEAALGNERVKIWAADQIAGTGAAGTILNASADGIVVACGEGALRIRELQRPGAKRLSAKDFLQGRRLALDRHP
jgi:methionyl-tRNA formyltransferase